MIKEKPQERIALMSWDSLEDKLMQSSEGATRGVRARVGSEERELREYYGDEEFEYLKLLATQSRTARAAGQRGNVVLLPGIMGSDLASVKDGDEDHIWVNIFRLAWGRIERLKLSADGDANADASYEVRATGVNKRAYSRAILWLRGRWNVETYPFDWRLNMDRAADGLASFIKDKFPNREVHLVAHSMGGLVSRNFIRLHTDLWKQMKGKLVMLGTPNYGSFAIPQVMTGEEKLVRWLQVADTRHNMNELLSIINTFVGSYQMLPAPNKLPAAAKAIYKQATWGKFPVVKEFLDRAARFHEDLENTSATIDPERMIYVAGYGEETFSALNINANGKFEYETTNMGDGRVPHSLGLLKDVPTYYIDEDHGNLQTNEKVLRALDELLESGRTALLSTARPAGLRSIATTSKKQRVVEDKVTEAQIKKAAEEANLETVDSKEAREAERKVERAALGQQRPLSKTKRMEERREREERIEIKLNVEAVKSDIINVAAPVIVARHYKTLPPTGAEEALNVALNGWISHAHERGMIGAELGQLFFIPIQQHQVAAKAVLLTGLGDMGHFGREDLRYIMLNVTTAVLAFEENKFATALIGTGTGNLSTERAIRSMLAGIADAIERIRHVKTDFNKGEFVFNVMLVEKDRKRYKEMLDALREVEKQQSVEKVNLSIKEVKPPKVRARKTIKQEHYSSIEDPETTRITIERFFADNQINKADSTFRMSALTTNSVIPVREIEVQTEILNGVIDSLRKSYYEQENADFGRLLHSILMPEDFTRFIDSSKSLTLILDRNSASIPWEMLSYGGTRGMYYFGTDLKLTRQFRTRLSSAPGVTPPLNQSLKVLVIADPAPPPFDLPYARMEGEAVVHILNLFADKLNIEVTAKIGHEECNVIEILRLIFNEEYDVIHYAGHGIFDEKNPKCGGWVFGENLILSANEIFRVRRVPSLVFSNACFTGKIAEDNAFSTEETTGKQAGLAEAFFERGIQNYIGTGWEVNDSLAIKFAEEFYESVLEGNTFGEALSVARDKIKPDETNNYSGSTWGAYQHYGHAGTRLVKR